MSDPATLLAAKVPNSKPCQLATASKKDPPYTYQDFANVEPSSIKNILIHKRIPSKSVQRQKFPCKLAAMLSDPGK
jgi:hypothetical protein